MLYTIGQDFLKLGTPVADHIWQSTLFALLAGCLTLFLRRNPARLRFGIWLVASIKFLVPFALIIRVGQFIGPRRTISSVRALYSAVEIVGQPFGRSAPHITLQSAWQAQVLSAIPALLVALWIAGCLATFVMWGLGWRRVYHTRSTAEPICQGPELDLLRALEVAAKIKPVPLLLSHSRFEPGVFGIVRPVLLWPAGFSGELKETQLNAILAHEVWHVRRRDNLAAALQMFIEAVFWFHPVVWWLGFRQMDERERACDEGVLELGSEPTVYAEGILKACKFCVESPVPCVAGVNGSNLKKRIVRIMTHKDTTALTFNRKFLLTSLAVAVISSPLLFGMASSSMVKAQENSSGSASGLLRITAIRRDVSGSPMTQIKHTAEGTSISNTTVRNLIQMAYSIKSYQLSGGPSWLDQDRYDIAYTGGEPSGPSQGLVSNLAIKEILSQRFHLVLRQETKPGPVFALVVSKMGPKLAVATPPNAPGTNEPLLSMRVMEKDGQGQIEITGGPEGLAESLSAQVGRPIIDKTGLTGIYAINFHCTLSASAESISADLQQQLGLELIPQVGPVQTSVIDSVDMPAGS
jgi:bla regulator protein blaR1